MAGLSALAVLAALAALFGAGAWVRVLNRIGAHGMADARSKDALAQAAVVTAIFLVLAACAALLGVWIIDA